MTPPTSKNFASRVLQGVAVISIAAIFFSLGIWQLDRARALKASLVVATTVDENIVTLDSVTAARESLPPSAMNRMVSTSGRYVADFKAPNQSDGQGVVSDWQVSLLQVGTGSGILVVRGLWADRMLNPDISHSMSIDITGQLHARQDSDHAQNTAGIISRLDSAVIVSTTDLDLFDGYILATSESYQGQEIDRPRTSPEKQSSRIPGFYWQHLSYVVIWWLMAGVVLYLPLYRRKVDL
ncbi:MAG: SURF1 family protein [Candidatus Planktophila sp.]